MKRIKVRLNKGKMITDMDGFRGGECQPEFAGIRFILGRLGMITEPQETEEKKNGTANGTAERTKLTT